MLIPDICRLNNTGVKVLVTSKIGASKVKRVFNTGNGPFIYSFFSGVPVYLNKKGGFANPQQGCNGEAVEWLPHVGSLDLLNWVNHVH